MTLERLAETLDKLEEDVLQVDYPQVRGVRRVEVRFGEPIPVVPERQNKAGIPTLTQTLQTQVQRLLDEINTEKEQK